MENRKREPCKFKTRPRIQLRRREFPGVRLALRDRPPDESARICAREAAAPPSFVAWISCGRSVSDQRRLSCPRSFAQISCGACRESTIAALCRAIVLSFGFGRAIHQEVTITRWKLQDTPTAKATAGACILGPMSNAFQFVFECRKCHQKIGVPRKSCKSSVTEAEVRKMFAGEEVQCPECRWRGKASRIKLLRIVPFNWICSPAA